MLREGMQHNKAEIESLSSFSPCFPIQLHYYIVEYSQHFLKSNLLLLISLRWLAAQLSVAC